MSEQEDKHSTPEESEKNTALKKLKKWVKIQIDGFEGSGMIEASRGALNAFELTLERIEFLEFEEFANSPEIEKLDEFFKKVQSRDGPTETIIDFGRI